MSEDNKNELDALSGDFNTDFVPRENNSSDGQNREKLSYLIYKEPGKYQVRLAGKYVKYLSYYQPFKGKRVITHPSYKDKDPAWLAKFYPQVRFAIHVIDRKDGKLKILDASKSLFKCFHTYMVDNKCDPTGKVAHDFIITVEKNGQKKSVTAAHVGDKTTLSKEDIEMILAKRADLKKVYKATALQKIQELWDALPEEQKIKKDDDDDGDSKPAPKANKPAEKEKPASPEAVEESMPNAPAEDEDLFGDSKGKKDNSW